MSKLPQGRIFNFRGFCGVTAVRLLIWILIVCSCVLRVANLCVNVGGVPILSNISFSLQKGEIMMVCGPNGAGKTSLIKVLISERSGRCVHYHDGVVLGYVPQLFSCNRLIPMTVFYFLSSLCNRGANFVTCGLNSILETYQISHIADYQMSDVSPGEMQKVLMVACILRKVTVAILDEPDSCLDAESKMSFYKKVCEKRALGQAAIILTSHNLEFLSYSDKFLYVNKTTLCYGKSSSKEVQEFIKNINKS